MCSQQRVRLDCPSITFDADFDRGIRSRCQDSPRTPNVDSLQEIFESRRVDGFPNPVEVRRGVFHTVQIATTNPCLINLTGKRKEPNVFGEIPRKQILKVIISTLSRPECHFGNRYVQVKMLTRKTSGERTSFGANTEFPNEHCH